MEVQVQRKRICVIGGGITGLSCSFALSATADVTLLERHANLGSEGALVFSRADSTASSPPPPRLQWMHMQSASPFRVLVTVGSMYPLESSCLRA